MKIDPCAAIIEETLREHARLVSTRIFDMLRARGVQGSAVTVRRRIALLRPRFHEPFRYRRLFAGEEAQIDRAHFGQVEVGSGSALGALRRSVRRRKQLPQAGGHECSNTSA